jgi:hypothetical protein
VVGIVACMLVAACAGSSAAHGGSAATLAPSRAPEPVASPSWAPPPTAALALAAVEMDVAQERQAASPRAREEGPIAPAGGTPDSKAKATWGANPTADTTTAANDAHASPLLIYEAELYMAVYKVEEIEARAIAMAREIGGYLAQHTDRTQLVLRVPATQFDAAIARIEGLGEITHRFVRAQDVTAQFRDLEIRLRNAETVRARLLLLLDKTADVAESLKVEAEVDRLTERIEQIKGQLKLMGDQIAFSTITIQFSVKRNETIDGEPELPFPWLHDLGLQHLLSY